MSAAASTAATPRSPTNSCRNRHCPKCQGRLGKPGSPHGERSCSRSLFPRGLHPAGADRRHRLPEQGGGLRHPVPRRRRDPAPHRGRPAPPRRRDRRRRGAAQLGPAMQHHPHVHCIVPGGGLARPHALDRLPTRVLPVGQGAQPAVPAALSRAPRRRLRRRRAALLRRSRPARRAPRLRRPLRGAAPDRLGGLRQAALRRPRAGAGLSRRYMSPSPTAGSSPSPTMPSASSGRTTGRKAAARS